MPSDNRALPMEAPLRVARRLSVSLSAYPVCVGLYIFLHTF